MDLKFKKSGFTLAEIMVTLGLIGCLATLTITTIGSSVQQRARLAEFRAAFARLEAALKSIEADRGSIYACYYGSVPYDDIDEQGLRMEKGSGKTALGECNAFLRAFTKTMGAVRSCETKPVEEGCIPANYPATGCDSYDFKKAKRAYVFDNSMIFMTYYDTNKTDFPGRMAIDINGRKGPNKWGQDIFPLSLSVSETVKVNDKTYIKNVYFTQPNFEDSYYRSCFIDGNGRSTREMMKESAAFD
ncbi:MAG: type II secretion system GspH family protein [Muribaculaceae bacterium]|nr:type II secretion system GspH family protein [Muribaculaceae bacterium]